MELPPPVIDKLEGQVVRSTESSCLILILGSDPLIRFPGKVLMKGEIALTYAFSLYANDAALVPQFVMDDFRRSYTGVDAIRFLLQKGDTYPRADVIGMSASTGQRKDRYVKEVDLGSPLKVAAYGDSSLTAFVGFLDMVVKLEESQQPETWTDIAQELNLPTLTNSIPCVQVHPDSVLAIVRQVLDI